MSTKTIDLSKFDDMSKLVGKTCTHAILNYRNGVARNAILQAREAKQAWATEAPYVSGLSRLNASAIIFKEYKYSSGLEFDTAKHAIQANALNAGPSGLGHGTGSRWMGYKDRFVREQGEGFYRRQITQVNNL